MRVMRVSMSSGGLKIIKQSKKLFLKVPLKQNMPEVNVVIFSLNYVKNTPPLVKMSIHR